MILSVTNQKGGVGKTTTATAMAAGLKQLGETCLLIDTDPQANASDTYKAREAYTIYDVFTGACSASEAIQETDMGKIIPGDLRLSAADMQFTKQGREYILRKALEPLRELFSFVVVDTPPALGIITINALTASDGIVIPIIADRYSLQGITQLSETIETVKEYSNPDLRIEGILLTRYNSRTVLGRDIREAVEDIAKALDTKLYKTYIRQSIAMQESQTMQEDIFTFAPESTTAEDYKDFINEFLSDKKGVL